MVRVFFSYSHRDEALRNELETHLAGLKRQGVIETWHDRRIGAGKEFENEISENLENADIVLLLVSPDFIASDYCYDVEMMRALEKHESGDARVIPVILRPCDWHGLPFGRLLATPIDGAPVTKFPNQDEAFLEVTKAIKAAAADLSSSESGSNATASVADDSQEIQEPSGAVINPEVRSGNLRIKKRFSDHERDGFIDDAFEYIARYFEGSLKELEKRYASITTRFKRVDSNSFTASIYDDGDLKGTCRVWIDDKRQLGGGIAYFEGERNYGNSINEQLTVVDDGYSLFLKPLLGNFLQNNRSEFFTNEGGAEYLWQRLIKPLQH